MPRAADPQDRFVAAGDPEHAEELLQDLIRAIARDLAAEDHRAELEAGAKKRRPGAGGKK